MQKSPLNNLIVLFLLFLSFQVSSLRAETIDVKEATGAIATYFSKYHIEGTTKFMSFQNLLKLTFNDEHSEVVFENFFRSLDPGKEFFLASDIAEFEKDKTSLDDYFVTYDVSFAHRVVTRYKERINERLDFVDEVSTHKIDMDVDETVTIDYDWDKNTWAKDKVEQNDRWRKRFKHNLLAHQIQEAVNKNPASSVKKKTPVEKALSTNNRLRRSLKVMTDSWIVQVFFNAHTMAFDTHSAYLAPRAKKSFDIAMAAKLKGIGALLKTNDDGLIEIVKPILGGPAHKSGKIFAGDIVLAIAQGDDTAESVDATEMLLDDAVEIIRGEVDTEVTLTMLRASDGVTEEKVTIVRKEINLEEKRASLEVKEVKDKNGKIQKLAIVTLPEFYHEQDRTGKKSKEELTTSSSDVKKLLEKIRDRNDIDGVVLDLRGNGGGALPDAVEIGGYFIKDGPITQVVDKSKRARPLNDPDNGILYAGPLVVMVDKRSASASEIVAAALQDYGRAVVVGDSVTHGKGSVQTLAPVNRGKPENGSVKVTTAGFYRVNGETTQIKGVVSDIVVSGEYEILANGEGSLPNHLDFDPVAAGDYVYSTKLAKLIPDLKKQSEQRMASNKDMQEFKAWLAQLKSSKNDKEYSLKYSTRLKKAEESKLRADKITKLLTIEDEDAEESEKKKRDFVLAEGLNVLSDLIAAYPSMPEFEDKPAGPIKLFNAASPADKIIEDVLRRR